jgi:hypothetical protein
MWLLEDKLRIVLYMTSCLKQILWKCKIWYQITTTTTTTAANNNDENFVYSTFK